MHRMSIFLQPNSVSQTINEDNAVLRSDSQYGLFPNTAASATEHNYEQ